MSEVSITRWPSSEPPTAADIEALFRDEGLRPSWWSNGPGDRYAPHSHSYYKVLYCAQGSICFEAGGRSFDLKPGDRLDVPPGTTHSAVVGPDGVTCVEAARPS